MPAMFQSVRPAATAIMLQYKVQFLYKSSIYCQLSISHDVVMHTANSVQQQQQLTLCTILEDDYLHRR